MRADTISVLCNLNVGVELSGDLRRPLSTSQQRRLRELFYEHGLLLFRQQQLTHEQQARVVGYLGAVLSGPDGMGFISTDTTKGALGTGELAFHSDLSFTPHPYEAISLHAVDVVDGKSSTLFADGRRAYEALPVPLRSRVAGLKFLSVLPSNMATDRLDEDIPPAVPQFMRHVIHPHPETHVPVVYVSQQHTAHIDGVTKIEGRALIEELFGYLYAPENVYEHPWCNGDFIVWDNVALQHARGDLRNSGPRTLQKVVMANKSFYELCPQFRPDDPAYLKWLNASATP